jgi:hypothetical protein
MMARFLMNPWANSRRCAPEHQINLINLRWPV